MRDPILEDRGRAYAKMYGIQIDFDTPLGWGQDGFVWKSNNQTAVKALERRESYDVEVECYRRLDASQIVRIDIFAVPKLVRFDDRLQIVEMGLVKPPYLIDFAKSYLDRKPDYDEDVMREWEQAGIENFGEDRWSKVRIVIYTLRRFGIYYVDAKPQNIRFPD